MVDVPLVTYLQLLLPSVVGLAVFIAAWWVTFHFSRQRQSRGLYLVSLGFLVNWVLDSAWLAIYWIGFGGPFGYGRLLDQGSSSSEIQRLSSLLSWTGYVVWFVSLAFTTFLIVHGALTITQERQVVSAGIAGQK